MLNRRQSLIHGASAAAALALSQTSAFAQSLPETLKIIVGFPPGGTTDAFARRVGEKLRGLYWQIHCPGPFVQMTPSRQLPFLRCRRVHPRRPEPE